MTSCNKNNKPRDGSDVSYNSQEKSRSNILIMRHGERVDNIFGNWLENCITEDGRYIRKDLNMPITLPQRLNFPNSFLRDTPLTNVGLLQAKLTGEALAANGMIPKYAYCSPSFRCVQTCQSALIGLGIDDKLPIRVEPGLFECVRWYASKNQTVEFMTDEELRAAGCNIDTTYQAMISRDDLFKKYGNENCQQYYSRHHEIMEKILMDNPTDKLNTNYILIVGHASSLETCSRQLIGLKPRSEETLIKIRWEIPYCTVVHLEKQSFQWKLKGSPVPCMSQSENKPVNYNILINDD